MKKSAFLTGLALSCFVAYTQNNSIETKLVSADSVLVISHLSIPHSSIKIVDSAGKEISFPLTINGVLNHKAVVEKAVLDLNDKKRLAKILDYKKDNIIDEGQCFDPHHAILIYKSKMLSYIDLCFGCGSYRTSGNIGLGDIEEETWEKLYAFFQEKGFKYEMNND